jgi:TonB family protein
VDSSGYNLRPDNVAIESHTARATDQATSERLASAGPPAPPAGEAAAFVASLFSGLDQPVASSKDAASSPRQPETAEGRGEVIPTSSPPADASRHHNVAAAPLRSSRRGSPSYSKFPVWALLGLAVLIFGCGLLVGGVLGRLPSTSDSSTVIREGAPAPRRDALSKTVDDPASLRTADTVPANPSTANLLQSNAAPLTQKNADVLPSGISAADDLQAQPAPTGGVQSESPRHNEMAGLSLAGTTAPTSGESLAPAKPDLPRRTSTAMQPPRPSSYRPTASRSAMQPVGRPGAESDHREGAAIDSVRSANMSAGAKPSEPGPTTAFSRSPEADPRASASVLAESGPDGPREPIASTAGHIIPCELIHSVQPIYPRKAVKQHIEGDVELRLVVGADGTVRNVSVVSGPPLLAPAATDAVREFRYKPALLNGQAIETVQTINVSFKLKD